MGFGVGLNLQAVERVMLNTASWNNTGMREVGNLVRVLEIGPITCFRREWGRIVGWTKWLGDGVRKRCLIMLGNVDWMKDRRLAIIVIVTTLSAMSVEI